jgi:protoporphyrinogen oxidase
VRSIVLEDEAGGEEELEAASFLSSAPLTETIEMMVPPAPDRVLAACQSLRYLNHIAVNLKVRGAVFPDNWIYIHSEDVRAARIANYRNFSEAMAGGDEFSPLTIEYFALPHEPAWHRSDDELVSMAREDLTGMRIVEPSDIASAFVVRSEKAYPVIEIGHEEPVLTIKSWLDEFDNIVPIGRCGLFRYNNQDHAIATGLVAARRLLGLGPGDPWAVNIDAEYIEGGEVR